MFNRMVERHAGRTSEADPRALDRIFRALGDGTRRDMLRRLADGDRTVGELAEPCDMSLAAVRLSEAQRWLAFYQRFWTARFDALDRMLTADRATRPAKEKR